MRKSNILFLLVCAILALLVAPTAVAQEDGSSNSSSSKSVEEATSDSGQLAATPPASSAADPSNDPANNDINPSLIRRIGSPFAFSVTPNGTKVGPLTVTDMSSSGFYVYSTVPGQQSQSLWGNTTSGDIFWRSNSTKNTWVFQATPAVSVSAGQAFFNSESGLAFTRQVSARWTLQATNQFSFLQNTYLLNPQNVLAYGNGGFFLQTIYAQQKGAATYDSSNISMTYQLSGRTQLSLTPQVGLTFVNQPGSTDFVTYFGGGGSVNHNISATRSVSFSYNFMRSSNTLNSIGSASAWNSNTFGVGFRQQIGQAWWVTGNLSASHQSGPDSYWLPVGNIGVMRTFHSGSMVLGYSRSEAQQALLSSGYFDQADLAYSRGFGRRISASLGAGVFRTVQTGSHGQGERIFGSIYYRWIHNLSWVAAYNYSSQSGNQPGLNLGNSTYISFGLRYNLGRVPGL